MVGYDIETVISRLQDDIVEMENFVSAIESYVYSGRDLTPLDLRDLRGKLLSYNHPKYFDVCEYLGDLATKKAGI